MAHNNGNGQVRKGFFFYFGLLVLLAAAVFLICLVVLIFNPGKSFMGMQYFTDSKHYHCENTTDTNLKIDWNSINKLEINTSAYAKVQVQKGNELPGMEGIHVYNYAKGFSLASKVQKFKLSVVQNGDLLKVDITEPTGFMYFSRDVRVVFNILTKDGTIKANNIKLVINAKDGNVELGRENPGDAMLTIPDITAKTSSGNIYVCEKLNTEALTAFNLETVDGDILSVKNLNGKKGFSLNCDANIKTVSGVVHIENFVLNNKNLTLECKSGGIVLDRVVAKDINVRCVEGNYKFGEVIANLSYINSEDTILSPNIMIENIKGDFSLTTHTSGAAVKANPDIEIKSIEGETFIIAEKGTLNILSAKGNIKIDSVSLVINIGVSDKIISSNLIKIETEKSDINLTFRGNVPLDVDLTTEKGNVNVKFTDIANFKSYAYLFNNGSGLSNYLPDEKITFNFELLEGEAKNPFVAKGTGIEGEIMIYTNGKVNYYLA